MRWESMVSHSFKRDWLAWTVALGSLLQLNPPHMCLHLLLQYVLGLTSRGMAWRTGTRLLIAARSPARTDQIYTIDYHSCRHTEAYTRRLVVRTPPPFSLTTRSLRKTDTSPVVAVFCEYLRLGRYCLMLSAPSVCHPPPATARHRSTKGWVR
ncbi:hypothetical protein B0J12DRAFT_335373 [Macrophomina phaseolina]|uniref:Secreted protein n=1 Tax=Macrophomina phaseolina TaxID=35725 RepID=A0ABQ8GPD3_9PEZI|nr:hypothetical protein B0J12DRAFT_335373 [Macrophomina phaseolina]